VFMFLLRQINNYVSSQRSFKFFLFPFWGCHMKKKKKV